MPDPILTSVRIDRAALPPRSYVRAIPALQSAEEIDFTSPVTFLAGENGSGKSTLLEAVATVCGFNAEGGTRDWRFSTVSAPSDLADALTVVRGRPIPRSSYFLRAESFFNVATKGREYAQAGGTPALGTLHERSHGEGILEWIRTFSSDGLYLIDEPEAALSPQRQLTLLTIIDDCVRCGAQFVVATHSPILMTYPGAVVLQFDDAVRAVDYRETDSYRITDMAINRTDSLLHHLLGR